MTSPLFCSTSLHIPTDRNLASVDRPMALKRALTRQAVNMNWLFKTDG